MLKFVVLACFIVGLSQAAVDLPSNFEMCHKSDVHTFSQCAKAQIENLRPHLATGVPSMSVPVMEPLVLPVVTFDKNYYIVVIKATFTDVQLKGLTNFSIKEMRVDPETLNFYMKVNMPEVIIENKYQAQGKMIAVPFNGSGNIKLVLHNSDIVIKARGEEVTDENGVKRVKVKSLRVVDSIANAKMFLHSPSAISRVVQNVFNTNSQVLIQRLAPLISENLSEIVEKLVVDSLARFTKEELIPSA